MDHYGQHSMNSVNSSMNNLSVSGGMPSYPSNLYYRPMGNETSSDDFFPEFVKTTTTHTVTTSTPEQPPAQQANSLNIVPAQQQQQAPYDAEVLSHLRTGMTRMLATLERLEQRITRVEQVTSTILKNQQEVFQVPFMSQKDIDTARQLAEQLEQDTSVAKQLQAAYNKEIEVRKNQAHPMAMADCPICGARVSQGDLEVHVDQCLEMFSNDPKKQVEVKETKQKVEQGFFSRMFNKTKTETTTTTTKAITSRSNSSTNLPETDKSASSLYPAYGYHPNFMPGMMSPQQMQQMQSMQSMQNMQGNMPMMMPMYMYGGYPNMNQGE